MLLPSGAFIDSHTHCGDAQRCTPPPSPPPHTHTLQATSLPPSLSLSPSTPCRPPPQPPNGGYMVTGYLTIEGALAHMCMCVRVSVCRLHPPRVALSIWAYACASGTPLHVPAVHLCMCQRYTSACASGTPLRVPAVHLCMCQRYTSACASGTTLPVPGSVARRGAQAYAICLHCVFRRRPHACVVAGCECRHTGVEGHNGWVGVGACVASM